MATLLGSTLGKVPGPPVTFGLTSHRFDPLSFLPGRKSRGAQEATTMNTLWGFFPWFEFSARFRSAFVTLDAIGFHAGNRSWETAWTPLDGWTRGMVPGRT